MQIYFETDYIVIFYDEADRTLVSVVKQKLPTSEEFRAYKNAVIEAMEHFRTGKVIFDIIRQDAISPGDQEWLTTDWCKRALKAGYSHCAFVLPVADIHTRISLENLEYMYLKVIPVTCCFKHVEEAIEWIKQF